MAVPDIETLDWSHTEHEVWHKIYQMGGPLKGQWQENKRTFKDEAAMLAHVADLKQLRDNFAESMAENSDLYPFNPFPGPIVISEHQVFVTPMRSRRA